MDMSIRFPNLQIYFGYVGRSVSVFGFEITIYGLLIAAGMLLGLIYVLHQAKVQNENQNLYLEMMIPAMLGGLIGARAFYVLFNWNLFSGQTAAEICDVRNGGMSLYGGILGGALLAALYCRIRKVSFQRMADTASMGLLITQIIGIWGNFFNRESFGGYTDSLFAMQIPLDVVRPGQITDVIEAHLVTVGDVSYIQVHPLFLYESLWCLLLFLVLLFYTRRKTYQGEIFLRYLAGVSLGGVGIEWLRTDALKIPGTDFPAFLPVCAFLFIVCGVSATVRRILWKKREAARRRRREERYAAEEKATLNYNDMQGYENVAGEFWNAENAAEDKENVEEASGSQKGREELPDNTGADSGDGEENQPVDGENTQEHNQSSGENKEAEETCEEIPENGGDTGEDTKDCPPDTENHVVETEEETAPVPPDRENAEEAEPDGGEEPEPGKMPEDQPAARRDDESNTV